MTGIDPNVKSTILRSTDRGVTWELRSTTGIGGPNGEFPGEALWVVDLQPDPRKADRLYAILGGSERLGSKIFRSDDGGGSWRYLPLPDDNGPEGRRLPRARLLLDPTRPNMVILLAAESMTTYRFFRSRDAGETWETVRPQFSDCVGDVPITWGVINSCITRGLGPIQLDPSTGRYYADAYDPGLVFESDDGGSVWRPLANGWRESRVGPIVGTALAVRLTRPPVVYAGSVSGVSRYVDLAPHLEPSSPGPNAIIQRGATSLFTYPIRSLDAASPATVTVSGGDWLSLPAAPVLVTRSVPLIIDARSLVTGVYTTSLTFSLDVPDVGVISKTVPYVIKVGERWTAQLPIVPAGALGGW